VFLVLIFSPLDLLLESRRTGLADILLHHHCVSWRYIGTGFFTVAEIFALILWHQNRNRCRVGIERD